MQLSRRQIEVTFACTIAALLVATPPVATPVQAAAGAEAVSGLNAAQLFEAAERLLATEKTADAEILLQALTQDADPVVRNEARFRLARLREAQGRRTEAAVLLRRILDDEPDAARVRLELARLLFQIGDEAGARQQLRQAQGAGLPPDLVRIVDQFRSALRSRAPLGASIEVALAPDTNVNRATAQQTLEGGFFPIDLDEEARARSGIGVALNGQMYARFPIGGRLSILPRLSGAARLYSATRFNDISVDSRLGLERADSTAGRLTISAGLERRWFGGRPLTRNALVAVDWLRPVSRTAQLTVNASATRQRFANNQAQNGGLYQLSLSYERALTQRTGISLTLSGSRQNATDAGYSNWSGGATALGYAEIGRTTAFASLGVRRLEADGPFFLFPEPRREWLLRSLVGATIRQLTIAGFSPVVRIVVERNKSTVGLFDYRRIAGEFGISRAF